LRTVTKTWHLLPHDRAAIERLAASLRLSPVVAQLLLNRGLMETAAAQRFLQAPLIGLHAPELLPGVRQLVEEGHVPDGTRTNLELAAAYTDFGAGLDETDRLLACDAQTSGGLLVALPADRAATLPWPVIGRLSAGPAGTVLVD